MMSLMILLGWVVGGVIIELIAASKAPLGYQDETGFHLGQKQVLRGDDWQFENPS